VLVALTMAFIIYLAIVVRPSDLQLVTHYTAYGVTHLYRDQWFYLLSFVGFAILVAFLNTAIAIKLYLTKGHPLAVTFAWVSIGIIAFAWITAISIINVWSPV
jgi:hypothetical protein